MVLGDVGEVGREIIGQCIEGNSLVCRNVCRTWNNFRYNYQPCSRRRFVAHSFWKPSDPGWCSTAFRKVRRRTIENARRPSPRHRIEHQVHHCFYWIGLNHFRAICRCYCCSWEARLCGFFACGRLKKLATLAIGPPMPFSTTEQPSWECRYSSYIRQYLHGDGSTRAITSCTSF